MKSFMLSVLVSQYAKGTPAAFKKAHPNDWLVWEPGEWKPSTRDTVTFSPKISISGVRAGESLCIVLDGAPDMIMGRAPSSEIVINDGTISSRHLKLHRQGPGWSVEDLRSRNGTRIDGVTLLVGVQMPVPSGARIVAGNVTFTFLSAEGMWLRLNQP